MLFFDNIPKFILLFNFIISCSIFVQHKRNNNKIQDAMSPCQTQEFVRSNTDHPRDNHGIIENSINENKPS
jgi:hypothetical protein